jgi:hypothetical protein
VQIKRAHQTITKYLASFVNDDKLDWKNYLAPLVFCYSTLLHRSIKQTPHFMTFGVEPNKLHSQQRMLEGSSMVRQKKMKFTRYYYLQEMYVARRNNEGSINIQRRP